MGGGKGASSSQTVSIPPEVLARYNAVNARAENVAQTPFTPYSTSPEAFVAPLTASQQAGIANINAQQGAANEAVGTGQGLQMQGIDTAQRAQAESRGIDLAALQGISQAQQQGTAYNQAAGKNIFNAMGSAAPYMQGMAALTQAGLGQGQQYLGGATGLTRQAIETGQRYANQAQPFYTGALQAAQPFNRAAQQYMQAGAEAVGPGELNYSQYMNPYMKDVVQAQQALQAQENAQARSAMRGKAIQSGAFGGDRAGIEQANLARQQSLANQATLANLLQSGYGQAQQMAAQQQGVGLSAAQANRAAQQQAAQQAAALGQQGYAQQLGLGQALAALGQQQYGQALGTGAQIGQLGQQGYTQNLGAGAQLGNVGQQLYAQNIGQGQAIQGLGQQQFAQGLQGSQAASGIAQNMYGRGAQTAGLQQAGGMNVANLGLQNQAAQIAAAQAQMAAGQQEQQTEQAGKTALYNQFLQQQGYPFQIAQFLTNTALGTGALSGSTTTAQRTGYRGGRMGDGYASGGLIPDSQGGAVFEPGLYGRGGYEDGGAPDYDAMVKQAYAGIGRSGMGSDPSNIDQAGLDYWKGQLQSGAIAPEDFNNQFNQSVQSFVAANPNDPTAQYVSNYQKQAATAPSQGLGNATTPAATAPTTTSGLGAAATTPAATTSTGDNSKYDQIIREAYAGIGRSGIGTNANNIDLAGYNYWLSRLQSGALKPDDFTAQFNKEANAYVAANPNAAVSQVASPQLGYQAVAGVNKDIAEAFKDLTGKDIDAVSARKYQDMLNSGMSLDQIKYNIGQSQPALLKAGDVNALKGQSLAYDPSKFAPASGVTYNRFGSFSAGNFTPQMPQATGKGAQQPQPYGGYGGGYGNMMGGYGGYGSYGGGYGYGQPSNYGMPNFGSSPQYGGAPDYAGAGLYASNQYNMSQMGGYGMPNYGYGYGMPPQMGGYDQYAQQPPQATGKGASQAPTVSGKGASGMKAGGRAGFADGGRAGYASQGYVDPSETLRSVINSYNPGDPQGLVGRQAAMFANAPGSSAGYVPPTQSMAGQYKMLTPQASILPEQRSGLKEAVSMGTSIASLGDASGKLYDKLAKNPTTGVVPDSFSEGMSNFGDKFKNLFGMGNAAGGRIGLAAGGIPGLDDLKPGYADIPGGEGLQTPMSKVVEQGTQTPADLKAQMDRMSAGSSGLGGSSGGGLAGALGTASSLASLGSMAFKVGGWMMGLPIFASGGRVGKADGGALVDPSNPQDQAMSEAFDNLLQRYDNNPLLAAAAMDVGTEAVDAAIMKAQQTGGDITDFLPRRTQEYMFALSKAAMGAHDAMNREARAAGGRTGYAIRGGVNPSDAMTIDDFEGGLAPTEAPVQLAGTPPTTDKPKYSPKDIDYMARTLLTEAGNQGDEGMAAVGHVIKNRYDSGKFGPDIASIVTAPKQFSPWNPDAVGTKNDPRLIDPNSAAYKKAQALASGILEGSVANPLPEEHRGALNFANPKFSTASWVPDLIKSGNYAQLGEHVFGTSGAAPKGGLSPQPQAGEQKPVQMAMASGLMPKTASDQPAAWETIGKKILPDAVPTDSSFWVPLIAGLGAMLGSDKYRFSQRLGEGLVGGASAYAAQQKIGAETELQRAQAQAQQASAFQTYSNIPKNAIFVQNGKEYVMLSSGQPMLMGQYLSLPQDKRPSIVGQQQLGVYGQPAVPGAAQPAAQKQEEKGAPLTAPKPGAVETQPLPAPSAASVAPATPAAPAKPSANVFAPTPEEAEEAHKTTENWANYGHQTKEPDFYTDQSILASGAQKQKQILLPLANDMANLPKTGMGSSGPLQTYLNPIASYLNNLANIAGSPGLIVDPQVLADQEGVKKLVTQLQATATTTAGQHAFQAFKSMADGIPSLITSPEGQAKLLAQMMTNTQREIDKDNYFADYRKAAQGDKEWLSDKASQTSRLANRNFDNRIGNKVYAEERENLEKMFKQTVVPKNPDGSRGEPISVLALMTSGKPISDDFKKQIADKYGKNIFRYFGM